MTYYENVRVSGRRRYVVGGINGGWRLITTQLNHERIGLAAFGSAAFCANREGHRLGARHGESGDGGKVIDQPWVQQQSRRDVMRASKR